MKGIQKIIPRKLWRLETVDLGGGRLPTRLGLSSALKKGENDPSVTEYLMYCRHVMCRTHFQCLNHAGDQNWDGFDCGNCPRASDPSNRISQSEIVDDIQDLILLIGMVGAASFETSRLPPGEGPRSSFPEQ